jgi:hypothetical protein
VASSQGGFPPLWLSIGLPLIWSIPLRSGAFCFKCIETKGKSKAMIRSSRRDRKAEAIAEVLAMIDDTHPELSPPRPVRETDEGLAESATEFCAVLDRCAERAARIRERESLIRYARSLRVRPPISRRGPNGWNAKVQGNSPASLHD